MIDPLPAALPAFAGRQGTLSPDTPSQRPVGLWKPVIWTNDMALRRPPKKSAATRDGCGAFQFQTKTLPGDKKSKKAADQNRRRIACCCWLEMVSEMVPNCWRVCSISILVPSSFWSASVSLLAPSTSTSLNSLV